ncbi:Spy/CpxP family protein refolding chaperone [Roseofilum casamattae]|uniref:Spy/CpxP family protein refolding chaperone n=1 Tax=Roseofilum casamattae BLCC-M143 TaxID=3022442 RepID=A0ABT7BW31_9CYAN|nr:Spy/CpxP family protein refolding chaperone [Roseofilum casamattae]MDJ1183407.1 Spy/CpxP family protein refolding chaperone [Roseofilum casamattae BLCC-M143]
MMSINPKSITRLCAVTFTVLMLGGGMAEARPSWGDRHLNNADSNSLILAQRGPGQRGNRGDRLIQELNLSPDQQQQMQAIKSRYQPQMEAQKEQVQQAREQLRDLMVSNASDGQIRAQHQQVQQLMQQMGNLRFNSMLEVRAILDSSQRQQFANLMEQKHRGGRPGGRRGQPGNVESPDSTGF